MNVVLSGMQRPYWYRAPVRTFGEIASGGPFFGSRMYFWKPGVEGEVRHDGYGGRRLKIQRKGAELVKYKRLRGERL